MYSVFFLFSILTLTSVFDSPPPLSPCLSLSLSPTPTLSLSLSLSRSLSLSLSLALSLSLSLSFSLSLSVSLCVSLCLSLCLSLSLSPTPFLSVSLFLCVSPRVHRPFLLHLLIGETICFSQSEDTLLTNLEKFGEQLNSDHDHLPGHSDFSADAGFICMQSGSANACICTEILLSS